MVVTNIHQLSQRAERWLPEFPDNFRFSTIGRGLAEPSAFRIEPGFDLESWRRSGIRRPAA